MDGPNKNTLSAEVESGALVDTRSCYLGASPSQLSTTTPHGTLLQSRFPPTLSPSVKGPQQIGQVPLQPTATLKQV
ncbi:hypothetical protein E4U55_004995 [Claviceps digitariae]|nr:hypothetical protein E4U55_004995 [Claviceps digitariae]